MFEATVKCSVSENLKRVLVTVWFRGNLEKNTIGHYYVKSVSQQCSQ